MLTADAIEWHREAYLKRVALRHIIYKLFRAQNVAKRAQYVALVEAVQAVGTKVHVFSSGHASGEQLASLSGVAAILRFPLAVEEFIDAEEEDDDDDDDDEEAPFDDEDDDPGEDFDAADRIGRDLATAAVS